MSVALPPSDLLLAAATLPAEDLNPTSLHPDLIAGASSDELAILLPLLLSACTRVRDRHHLRAIVSALRQHLRGERALRARFLLLASHPSFEGFWKVPQLQRFQRSFHPDEQQGEEEQPQLDCEEADQDDDDNCIWFDEYNEEVENDVIPDSDRLDYDFSPDIEDRDFASSRPVKQVVLSLPLDTVDLASLKFWKNEVHDRDVEEGHRFDIDSLVNPLTHPLVDQHDGRADAVIVRKVFSSIARPKIVYAVEQSEDEIEETIVPPGVLVKFGDNLMHDVGVQIVFQLLNVLWHDDSDLLFRFGKPPVAVYYDVLPTSIDAGIMQAVSGLESLKEFDWPAWTAAVDDDHERILDMVRSAAGSYIAAYIVGARDRHFDNILIKEERYLLHIDFTYILGNGPPLDGPAISLASEMQEAFEALHVWDRFVDICTAAFSTARQNGALVVHVGELAFSRSGMSRQKVRTFLRGRKSLDLGVDEESVEGAEGAELEERAIAAERRLEQQVRGAASDPWTWIKRLAHEHVDPVWYGMLKNKFVPAVTIMEMLDKHESAEAHRLVERLREEAAAVTEEERLEVDG